MWTDATYNTWMKITLDDGAVVEAQVEGEARAEAAVLSAIATQAGITVEARPGQPNVGIARARSRRPGVTAEARNPRKIRRRVGTDWINGIYNNGNTEHHLVIDKP